MKPAHRRNPVSLALWANAAVLAAILATLALRHNGSPLVSAAWGDQAPIAGGSGVYIMPAQLSPNNWGCFLLDTDAQTLVVYQFSPGEKLLRLVSARTYKYDRHLQNVSTEPKPREIKALLEMEQNPRGGNEDNKPAPPDTPGSDHEKPQ